MLRLLVPLLFAASIPWAALTWWRARRARSEDERQFVIRTHTGMAIFAVLAVISLATLGPREKLFALPIFLAIGTGIRHGIRKGRARIQAEQADPARRMKRVN